MSERKDKKKLNICGNGSMKDGARCIKVDAIIEVDKRGQILLPKSVRERANIKTGQKYVLITCESGEEICCMLLIKVENFIEGAKDQLAPIMKDIFE
jgi:antitoxin PrlF